MACCPLSWSSAARYCPPVRAHLPVGTAAGATPRPPRNVATIMVTVVGYEHGQR